MKRRTQLASLPKHSDPASAQLTAARVTCVMLAQLPGSAVC